jgi:metal-responsive CopG/Arc/MetJ family transcriptional regulator
MERVLFTLPDDLTSRLRFLVPEKQRSKFISNLLEKALLKREDQLFKIASEVEMDDNLNMEMQDWDITLNDGLDDEPW